MRLLEYLLAGRPVAKAAAEEGAKRRITWEDVKEMMRENGYDA